MSFLAPLAPIFSAIGAGASIFGGISGRSAARGQARQTQQQAALNAQIARENAAFELELAEHNAEAAIQQAAAQEVILRRDRDRRISTTRAAFGAAGVQLQGTPLEVLADEAMEAEEDALLIRFGGERAAEQARLTGAILARRELQTALGFQTSGQLRADSLRAQGTASLISGFGAAGETLLNNKNLFLAK